MRQVLRVDFELSDDYRALVETVREFGERWFTFENVNQWQRDEGLPDEVVRDFVKLDFHGFGVIHRREHKRYDPFAQVLVLEELARTSGAALPFANDFLNLQTMEEFAGTGEFEFVRSRYQEEGRLAFALATSEPQSGSDSLNIQTKVVEREGRLLLNGEKIFVNNGEYAPYLLVSAIDTTISEDVNSALSFWLVPHGSKGIKAYPIEKVGQSLLPFSSVVFEDVELDESWRLHGKRPGVHQLLKLFEIGRLFGCASALGEAQAAMEDAVAFAREREAFGSQITDFQLVQELLVDMEVRLQNMRMAVYRAAWMLENDAPEHPTRLAVALAKRSVPSDATKVASDAMQIMGGRGYTRSQRVSSIWQDCRGFQIADGTDQIMVRVAAPLLLEKYEDR